MKAVEHVSWRGTWGVGDFMWALNSCHLHAVNENVHVVLEMHWDHDEDFYHHFEEEETIIERMFYIHSFYARQEDVTITNVFNSRGKYYYPPNKIKQKHKNRFTFEHGKWLDGPGNPLVENHWMFRNSALRDTVPNKVVIWRPMMNSEPPRTWKRFLTNEDWDVIINILLQRGLQVVELTYRTPVSEVMYHLSNCRQVVCYDGMWHYIAKNFAKPMIVISEEGVTKYHTPHAIRCTHNPKKKTSIWYWLENLSDMLGHCKKKAVDYENQMKGIINEEEHLKK